MRPRPIKHGHSRSQATRSRTYRSWDSAKGRCLNPNHDQYPNYGGRGIKICDRWKHDFSNFLADMGERPEGMTLDRIDVNGDYCPENCRWATPLTQRNNIRGNRYLEHNGQRKTVSQWAREIGISKYTLYQRLKSGWSASKAIETPLKPLRKRRIVESYDRAYA